MQQNRRQVLSLLGALLAGCADRRLIAPALAAPPLRIVVEPFEVRGLYADRGFVNRAADGVDWQSSSRSLIGPPSLLFGEVLVDSLRAAYGRDSVFAAQAWLSGDVSLRPALRRLERVPGVGGDQALLAIEVVVNAGSGTRLDTLAFSASLPAGNTPAEYLAAQSQLLACACEQLLTLLDRRLQVLNRSPSPLASR